MKRISLFLIVFFFIVGCSETTKEEIWNPTIVYFCDNPLDSIYHMKYNCIELKNCSHGHSDSINLEVLKKWDYWKQCEVCK